MIATATESAMNPDAFREAFQRIRSEVSAFMVGQDEIIEDVLIAICCGGHVLLEGVPGLGKTSLVNTLARVIDLQFKRIQFTPDLLPSDVVGTQVLVERDGRRELEFQRGPVFCNLLLADEINRATPKTQSALLETMQEKRVTVGNTSHALALPFFVLATQNPIESDGTYPLPEAQLDRFFFKLQVGMPGHEEFKMILERTGGTKPPAVRTVSSGKEILAMGQAVPQVPVAGDVRDFLVHVVRSTQPTNPGAPDTVKKFVRHGASPRAGQAMLAAARVRAMLDGRFHVAKEDVVRVARPALRHRMILSFEGEADGIQPDTLVDAAIAAAARV